MSKATDIVVNTKTSNEARLASDKTVKQMVRKAVIKTILISVAVLALIGVSGYTGYQVHGEVDNHTIAQLKG